MENVATPELFNDNTMLYTAPLPVQTRPVGGGQTRLEIPKNGILAGIMLNIAVAVSGSLSNQNALGASSIIRNVRLSTNSSVDLLSVSGAGYGYLMQRVIGLGEHVATPQNQFNTAITATTFNLDMWLPLQINPRDPVGLFLLQNPAMTLTLTIDWEADATVATGATVTGTATPQMHFYSLPNSPKVWPSFGLIHRWIEETEAIAASGDHTWESPRGSILLGVLHGAGIGVGGSDNFTRVTRRVNHSTIIDDYTPAQLNSTYRRMYSTARPGGVISFDFLGQGGMGSFGISRDTINTRELTDYEHVLVASGSGTLRTIRRELLLVN